MHYSTFLSDWCISEVNFVNTYTAKVNDYPMKNPGRHHSGLLYTIEGTETYHFYDKTISTEPNSLLFIPKEEKYTITFSGEKSIVKVIDFELLSCDIPRPFCIKFRQNKTIPSYFSDAEKIWLKKETAYSIDCKACFYKIIAQSVKYDNSHLNSTGYAKISAAVNYIHENYTDPEFRIEKLFKMTDVSPKYFETLFSNEYNMSPKEYVTSLKIERAKELLSNEKNKIGDIAIQIGYSDLYHFSKIFKSRTGHSPSEYRNHTF